MNDGNKSAAGTSAVALKRGNLFLASGALCLLIFGIWSQLDRSQGEEISSIASWQEAQGRLISARILEQSGDGGHDMDASYIPDVEYRFEVAGRQYVGKRLSVVRTDDTDLEAVENWMEPLFAAKPDWAETRSGISLLAREWTPLEMFKSTVAVYYDPRNPALSVLDREDYGFLARLHLEERLNAAVGLIGLLVFIVGLCGKWNFFPAFLLRELSEEAPVPVSSDEFRHG